MGTKLIDIYGNPLTGDALKEQQTARITSLQTTFAGHPSRGLTPARLARILESAEHGHLVDQAELFEDMEEKDAHLYAEMSKRKRALLTLDWNVVPPRNASKEETADAEFAEELLQDVPDLEDLVFDMMDAVGKGYSGIEIEWSQYSGTHMPKAFNHKPAAWFQLALDQQTLRLRDYTPDGEELWSFGWIVHTHKAKSGYLSRAGLYRILSWPFLFKNYSVRDLAEFLEIYGLPLRLGMYPPGASEKEKARLLQAVVSIGHDAAGIIPEGMKIEFQEAAKGAHDPFEAMMTWCERSMSKAILGGTLTSQADGASSTNALGNVHNEVRHDLLVADARQIASTLTRYLVYPLLALNSKRPVDPLRLPRFQFDTREPEDIQLYADALPKLAGVMDIPEEWAHEKLRIPKPQKGEAVLRVKGPAPVAQPTEGKTASAALKAQHSHDDDALDELADAMGDEWEQVTGPLLDQVEALCAECKDLEEFRARLHELGGALDLSGLQELLTRGAFNAKVAGKVGAEK